MTSPIVFIARRLNNLVNLVSMGHCGQGRQPRIRILHNRPRSLPLSNKRQFQYGIYTHCLLCEFCQTIRAYYKYLTHVHDDDIPSTYTCNCNSNIQL